MYEKLKRMLFIMTKTQRANFQDKPLYQATKQHSKQQLDDETCLLLMSCRILVCFYLSCLDTCLLLLELFGYLSAFT